MHRHHDHDSSIDQRPAPWFFGPRPAFAMAGGAGPEPWGPPPRPGRGGPPFGPFGRPGFGRGRRRGRGEVRSALLLLLADGPKHGYQLMSELEERSGGRWRPSPGAVYPSLQLLEDEGLVRGEDQDGKRVFRLTESGQAAAQSLRTGPAPWAGDPDGPALHQAAIELAGAIHQVALAGTPGQQEEAVRLVGELRRRLYRLLADEPATPDAGAPSDS